MGFNNHRAVDIFADKTELFPVEKKIFDRYLVSVGQVLDLGCGTGRTTRFIVDLDNDVTGSDISPLMINRARELHPDIKFEVQDACNLPYPDSVFDAVVFSFNGLDCIYPEASRMKALKEIYRVLNLGGVFIYSSHTKSATHNRRRNWRRRPRHYKGHYYKEKMVYGELIMFYGTKKVNLNSLRAIGFRDPKFYDNEGKTWRYYVTWK